MKTMKIRNLFIVGLLLPFLGLLAQTADEKKKEINRIKKNSLYIYAEATAATEEEAKDLAEEILYQEINEWAATQKQLRKGNNFLVRNRKELWSTMSLPRGNMYRSFIYVKKSNILPADNTEVICNNSPSPTTVDTGKPAAVTYPETVMQIAACQEYTEMAALIKDMEDRALIGHYARYASLSNPENYYLAIYDKTGKVRAVLTPGHERINVTTGKADAVTNYAGCGAIGFTLK